MSIIKVSVWCFLFVSKSDLYADPRLSHVCVATEKCVECMRNIIHLPVPWFQQLKIIFHKFFMTVNFSFLLFLIPRRLVVIFSFYLFLSNYFCCNLSLRHKKATYQRELMLTCRCFVMWLCGGMLRLEERKFMRMKSAGFFELFIA